MSSERFYYAVLADKTIGPEFSSARSAEHWAQTYHCQGYIIVSTDENGEDEKIET